MFAVPGWGWPPEVLGGALQERKSLLHDPAHRQVVVVKFKESPQAPPVAVTLATFVLLDAQVMVGLLTVLPLESVTVAVTEVTRVKSIEMDPLGESVSVVGVVGVLLCPQPATVKPRKTKEKISSPAWDRNDDENNGRMHPPRSGAVWSGNPMR
jgi:hypothetical protein